jgi:hypothetical protein
MQELGCDLLMICSNASPDSIGGIERAAADLHELGERAAKRDLRVAFEALAWGRHINDYRDAWEAVRRANHPAVGLVLDTFHILARKTDLGAIRSIPRDKLFLVQMADAPSLQMDYLSWSRHFRNFPGQGGLVARPQHDCERPSAPILMQQFGLHCEPARLDLPNSDRGSLPNAEQTRPGRFHTSPSSRSCVYLSRAGVTI